jgi:hypothetical protein
MDNDTQSFPLSAYYCTPLQPLLVHVNQPKAPVTNFYSCMVITINICVETVKYAGGGFITFRAVKMVNPWDIFLWSNIKKGKAIPVTDHGDP